MKNLTGLKERLVAIGEFANESVTLIDEMIAEASKQSVTKSEPAKVAPAKPAVAKAPAKVTATTTTKPEPESNQLAEIIAEYELEVKTVAELKEILTDAGVEFNKKAKALTYFVEAVAQAIADGIIGGEEEPEEEKAPEPVKPAPKTTGKVVKPAPAKVVVPEPEEEDEVDLDAIAEEYGLNDMELDELKEMCDDHELKYTAKNKKPALISIIATAIADGTIPTSDDGDEPEVDEDAPEEEVSAEVLEAEEKVRAEIAKKVKTGKLTIKKMKEFLKQYFEGDADCASCGKGCSDEDLVECYIDIHTALVDDDGDVSEFSNPYERRGMSFCCGKELVELENGNLMCEICGTEYDTTED